MSCPFSSSPIGSPSNSSSIPSPSTSPSVAGLNNVVYEQRQSKPTISQPQFKPQHDPSLLLQAIANTQLQAILEPNTLVIFKDLLKTTIELIGCTLSLTTLLF